MTDVFYCGVRCVGLCTVRVTVCHCIAYTFCAYNNVKVHPRTGHKGPEVE